MIYETERFKFTYNNKDWMIQIWKGRYGITSGAEVGVYCKELTTPAEMFRAVDREDFINIGFKLYKDGEPYMQRGPVRHWWVTGFKLGEIYYARDFLLEVTFYLEDRTKSDALESAIAAEGFVKNASVSPAYVRDGTYIRVYW